MQFPRAEIVLSFKSSREALIVKEEWERRGHTVTQEEFLTELRIALPYGWDPDGQTIGLQFMPPVLPWFLSWLRE